MQELPLPWAEYARLQAQSSQHFTIDSYCWGIEEEMNLFVEDPCAYTSEDARGLKRLRATASRRERSRQSIRTLMKRSWQQSQLMRFPTSKLGRH